MLFCNLRVFIRIRKIVGVIKHESYIKYVDDINLLFILIEYDVYFNELKQFKKAYTEKHYKLC